MAELFERIKNLRIEKGLRQIDLANELSVSKSTVSLWERGSVKPEFGTLETMADYFNVPLAYLLGSSDDRMPKVLTDEELDDMASQGVCDEYRDFFLKYVRLSEKSQAMIQAAANALFMLEKEADDLKDDNQYYIQVMAREAYEKRKKD